MNGLEAIPTMKGRGRDGLNLPGTSVHMTTLARYGIAPPRLGQPTRIVRKKPSRGSAGSFRPHACLCVLATESSWDLLSATRVLGISSIDPSLEPRPRPENFWSHTPRPLLLSQTRSSFRGRMDNNEGRTGGQGQADRQSKKRNLGRGEWRYVECREGRIATLH